MASNPSETKPPEETKAEESKPPDVKPDDSKPPDIKPEDSKPPEVKSDVSSSPPAETPKPEDTNPAVSEASSKPPDITDSTIKPEPTEIKTEETTSLPEVPKQIRRPKRIVIEKKPLTNDDYDLLREHIRMAKGMKSTVREELKKVSDSLKPPAMEPRTNRAALMRMQFVKEKRVYCRVKPESDIEKLKDVLEELNKEEKKKIRMNHTSKVRWMKIRNMPVFSEYFKENFNQFGKPPYRVPMKYSPFNMLWEADWIKNPYVWEDEQ